MTLAERLSEYVRAAFTGLWVQSFEQDDAVAEIARLCREQGWNLAAWDIDRGLGLHGGGPDSAAAVGATDPLAAIRSLGAMRGGISTEDLDPDSLRARVLQSPDMNGLNLVDPVTTPEPYRAADIVGPSGVEPRFRVAAYDYGIKYNILRLLGEHACDVTVFPVSTPASEIAGGSFDGVFLSNGPGDPGAVSVAIGNIKQLLGTTPVFGICLGHQLLAIALGARTYKLKFGHRGINQPVKRLDDGRVEVTSHNHGFAVDPASLADAQTFGPVEMSHINLNDDTCEGLRCLDVPAFSVQYHPEASPGPHDARYLFDRFAELMEA